MADKRLRIAISGPGTGGLTAAACPRRAIEGVERDGIAAAPKRHETTRLERTAAIQKTSARNIWQSGATNRDRVHGYDAWTTPLA